MERRRVSGVRSTLRTDPAERTHKGVTEDGSGPLHMFRYSIGTLSPLESFHSRFRDECLAREIPLRANIW